MDTSEVESRVAFHLCRNGLFFLSELCHGFLQIFSNRVSVLCGFQMLFSISRVSFKVAPLFLKLFPAALVRLSRLRAASPGCLACVEPSRGMVHCGSRV